MRSGGSRSDRVALERGLVSDLTKYDRGEAAAAYEYDVAYDIAQDAGYAPARPGRRRFLVGMGLTLGGLGAVVQFGPDWGTGAPARAPAPVQIPTLVSTVPVPRPIEYPADDHAEWHAFNNRYITPEGRVLDTGNGNASHSEGQGWALIAAQASNDPENFARIYDWTTRNLQRRPYDCLHAWRYRPGDANPVSDMNNATDGDIYIAAALARAAARWHRADYAAAAAKLGRAILGLVRQAGARTVLLPGAVGFETADAFTINPSYYAFGLFNDLAALVPSPLWDALQRDGLALCLQGRYGKWNLPPDWLRVDRHDGALSIAPGWPPRFSFDAIRVPMHLAWGKLAAGPLFDSFPSILARTPGHGPGLG